MFNYLVHIGFVLIVMNEENNRWYYVNDNSVERIIVCVVSCYIIVRDLFVNINVLHDKKQCGI